MEENKFFSGSPKTMFFSGFVAGIAVFAVLAALYLANMTAKEGVLVAQNDPTETETVTETEDDDPTDVIKTMDTKLPELSEDDHILGDPNAPVILIEYSDFECPYCNRHHDTMKQIMEEYEGQVAWVYRHFPLSFHPEAVPAAVASECAAEQDLFWDYADRLIENYASLDEELYIELAAELGLNTASFEACLGSGNYEDEIATEMSGGSAAGVTGTPGTFVNGTLVKGAVPFESFQSIIDSALAK